jgi:hypothetical protein
MPIDGWSTKVGPGTLRIWRFGFDLDLAAGLGLEKGARVHALTSGSVDPRPNAITLQGADLSFSASYEPYFDAFLNLSLSIDAEGDSVLGLEEAWLRSARFAAGLLQVKAGRFFTPFGLFNRLHLHDWTWQTQPVIASRVLGPDGHSGVGLDLNVKLPLPWHCVLTAGLQDPRGATQYSFLASQDSFEARPIGGRAWREVAVQGMDKLVYLARLSNRIPIGKAASLGLGGSALFGPSAAGDGARTTIVGADLSLRIEHKRIGLVALCAEYMHRILVIPEDPALALAADRLEDFGIYAQGIWFPIQRLGLGLRYEWATGRGQSVGEYPSRELDPYRGDRSRISPLIVFYVVRLARLKLQYNHDRAAFLPGKGEAHSFFLSASWSFGLGGPEHFGKDEDE